MNEFNPYDDSSCKEALREILDSRTTPEFLELCRQVVQEFGQEFSVPGTPLGQYYLHIEQALASLVERFEKRRQRLNDYTEEEY